MPELHRTTTEAILAASPAPAAQTDSRVVHDGGSNSSRLTKSLRLLQTRWSCTTRLSFLTAFRTEVGNLFPQQGPRLPKTSDCIIKLLAIANSASATKQARMPSFPLSANCLIFPATKERSSHAQRTANNYYYPTESCQRLRRT